MTKKSRQKFKYLENEKKSFLDEIKNVFRHYERPCIEANKPNFFVWEPDFSFPVCKFCVDNVEHSFRRVSCS